MLLRCSLRIKFLGERSSLRMVSSIKSLQKNPPRIVFMRVTKPIITSPSHCHIKACILFSLTYIYMSASGSPRTSYAIFKSLGYSTHIEPFTAHKMILYQQFLNQSFFFIMNFLSPIILVWLKAFFLHIQQNKDQTLL